MMYEVRTALLGGSDVDVIFIVNAMLHTHRHCVSVCGCLYVCKREEITLHIHSLDNSHT